MPYSDITLSRRLELAEANAAAEYAAARRRLFPGSLAESFEHAGATVIFDGIDSPVTQTFGLGLFEELTPTALDTIERFFLDRKAPVLHEVSPFAGAAALDLLCASNYRPLEISNVLYQPVLPSAAPDHSSPITVRVTGPAESTLWAEINAAAWSHDHPELKDFILHSGAISAARQGSPCFLASIDGQPAAAGALCIHAGVALFAGAATLPAFRRRGLQSALLAERIRYAHKIGCDLAMMVASAGSQSQHNAERSGFKVAYTRIKWKLNQPE